MKLFNYFSGKLPIILSIPHTGTYVPDPLLERFRTEAKQLPDTDWHLEKLYAFASSLGIHMLVASHSRYVVDLNRAPDGTSLYPGKFTTGLCPTTMFDGTPIYLNDMEPDEKEIHNRIQTYWQPYHNKLQSLIDALKAHHKRVIVFDAHSICSQVPKLFTGILPDLNLGTADGQSASEELTAELASYCSNTPYSSVLNGRFKGGYITRHYGNPAQGIDAIQLEMAQINYMNESFPFTYEDDKAKKCQEMLVGLLSILVRATL